jgi:hypothetical protein
VQQKDSNDAGLIMSLAKAGAKNPSERQTIPFALHKKRWKVDERNSA